MAMQPLYAMAEGKDKGKPEGKDYHRGHAQGHIDGWNAGSLDHKKRRAAEELNRALRSVRDIKNLSANSDEYFIQAEAKVIGAKNMIERTY